MLYLFLECIDSNLRFLNWQVRRISQLVLKREHAYIDTVGLGCVETPAKVYANV